MAKTNLSPLFDYVLIEPLEGEEKTSGGIILPDSAKEKPQKGKVIATGPGGVNEEGKLTKMFVKKGDVVFYKKWGGNEVKLEGKEFLLVEQKDILAIVE